MYTKEQYLKKIERREIKIVDLVKYIIKQWKKIILLSLIIFLVLEIGVFFANKNEEQSSQNLASMDSLSEIQRVHVVNALKLHEELYNLTDYIDNSYYMQLNPYDNNAYLLQYIVDAENKDAQKKIYELYGDYIENGGLKEQIEKQFESQINNSGELISLNRMFCYDEDDKIYLVSEKTQNVLSVQINAENESVSSEIAESVKKYLLEYKKSTVDKLIGNHELKLVCENNYSGFDQKVKNKQDDIYKSLDEKQKQLSSLDTTMSEEEKSVLQQQLSDLDSTMQRDNANDSNFSLFKLSIFVFVFSLLVGVGFYLMYYCFNDKVKDKHEIEQLFDLPCIANIKSDTNCGYNQTVSKEILMLCKTQNISNLFLSYIDEASEKIDISNALSELDDIKITVGSNICQSIVSMEDAKKSENIIAIIKYNKTSYKALVEFFQKCEYLNINIVGIISVE